MVRVPPKRRRTVRLVEPPDGTVDNGPDDGPDDGPPQLSALPFVVAFVGFVIVAVAAYVFLREDDPGRLVRPDGIQVVDADRVRLTVDGPFRNSYAEVTKVGYALGDDRILIELVIDEYDCPDGADCAAPTEAVAVELVLPEPIGDRRVQGGTGRVLVDCDRDPPVPTCR